MAAAIHGCNDAGSGQFWVEKGVGDLGGGSSDVRLQSSVGLVLRYYCHVDGKTPTSPYKCYTASIPEEPSTGATRMCVLRAP